MKKVCFVCFDFSIGRGGQRASINVANGLAQNGYSVCLLSEFDKNGRPAYAINPQIEYHTIISGEGRLRKDFFKIIHVANEILKQGQYECLVSVGYSANILCAILSKLNGIPYWHWEHYSLYNEQDGNDIISRFTRFIGVHTAKRYIVLTERSKQEFADKYSINDEKIKVIPNMIPNEAFVNSEYSITSKKIISVGKVEKVKGFDRLIEVANIVKEYAKGWEWHIYGSCQDEYAKQLIQLVHDYGLSEFVFFDGVSQNIYEKYCESSIFVLTSISECLPMTLLEGKANKLPLVSFDIKTGPREIIRDGVNGYLVEDGNVLQMSELLVRLINDTKLRNVFSKNSILDIDQYKNDCVIDKWMKLLDAPN